MLVSLENFAVDKGLEKKLVFIPILKKGDFKDCSTYHTIAFFPHDSMVMLKFFELCFSSMWNENFRYTTEFWRGWGVIDQIANIHWIMEEMKEWQKDIYLCSIDNMKYVDCGD